MDLTRQAETMIDLLSSDHTEWDDHYQKFHLSRGRCLYVARLWDGIVLWGNEIRLDELFARENSMFRRMADLQSTSAGWSIKEKGNEAH